jgi:hypothetical protein
MQANQVLAATTQGAAAPFFDFAQRSDTSSESYCDATKDKHPPLYTRLP